MGRGGLKEGSHDSWIVEWDIRVKHTKTLLIKLIKLKGFKIRVKESWVGLERGETVKLKKNGELGEGMLLNKRRYETQNPTQRDRV